MPKGICHTEYTPQHTYFRNQKLISVIDWDLINNTYFIYDVGTTLSTSLRKNSINFNQMGSILRGYESIRRLNEKEKEILFEAVKLGIFKFITWGLDEEEIEKTGWDKIGIHQANKLMGLGKENFMKELFKK